VGTTSLAHGAPLQINASTLLMSATIVNTEAKGNAILLLTAVGFPPTNDVSRRKLQANLGGWGMERVQGGI